MKNKLSLLVDVVDVLTFMLLVLLVSMCITDWANNVDEIRSEGTAVWCEHTHCWK